MKIVKIQRNRYKLESGIIITLGKEIVLKYGLNKREELTDKEYYEMLELVVISASYYYLAKRDYSKKELYNKLCERYREKEIVKKVLTQLEEKNFINDYEFALNYVKVRKGSKKKIEYELGLKGIIKNIIDEVMSDFDESEELEKAWKKLGNRDVNKKVASLMRKGFSYEKIKKLLK